MKYIKHKNQFPKVGFKVLLWIGLLYSSLGQALAQVPETDCQASKQLPRPSETAETAELEQEKIELKSQFQFTSDFAILHTNNIFDPNRKPYRTVRKRPDPKPEPQIDAFTLIGLMAYTAPKSSEADRQIAVLSGSSSEYNGVFKLNDQIDNLKLISLSDKAVSFAEGEATFSVDIGTGLRRVDGGAWKESSERVRTASRSGSSRSQYSSRGTARSNDNKDSTKDSEDKGDESDGSEDSAAELLRKMMERRQPRGRRIKILYTQ